MKLLLEFLAIFVIAILPMIVSSRLFASDKTYVKTMPIKQRVLLEITRDLGVILLIAYIVSSRPEGWRYVGLAIDPNAFEGAAILSVAATGYMLFILLQARARAKKNKQLEEQSKEIFEAGAWSNFKTWGERILYLPVLWLAVITEDIIFRGYLIFALSARTGRLMPWIILSITLSILIHLYQGINFRIIWSHVMFAGIFIIVALMAQTVIAAIIPHLVYDTVWILSGWAKLSKKEMRSSEATS
jgi:hypothetical protein